MKRKNFFIAACLCITVGFVLCNTTFAEPLNNFMSFQSQTNDTEELWQQFYDSEANKRLIDLKIEPIREEIKYLERSGGYYFFNSSNNGAQNSDTYISRLTDLQNQKLELENKKQQYELIKSGAEYQLTALGEIKKPHEIKYELLENGEVNLSEDELLNLQSEREYLKYQKDLLELDNKELEYKYKIGQISDSDFITQFKQTAAKKQDIQQQYELTKAKIEACSSAIPMPLEPKLHAPL